MSPGWAVTVLGVNVNLLFAATVTIIVAAETVKLWARAATTMLANILFVVMLNSDSVWIG